MELECVWPSLYQHKMKWNTRNQCKAVWMSSKLLLTNNPLKHHHYLTHTRERSRIGYVWKWEWRMPHLYSPALFLPMCPLAGKNIGELGPSLSPYYRAHSWDTSEFCTNYCGNCRGCRTTVIAHSKHIFVTKLLPCRPSCKHATHSNG